jgi:hypothetical protein
VPHFSRPLREVGDDHKRSQTTSIVEYDMGLRSPCHAADSASFTFGVGYRMSPTNWFLFVIRTPSILLALVIFATNLSSAEWKEKVLYSFQGGTDGSTPAGGVVDKQGNLYGTTQQGGGSSCPPISFCGIVFQLAPPAQKGGTWTETVLHVFPGVPGKDGATPAGGLVIDAAGNLYGTTAYGGSGDCVLLGIKGGCGTVFELEPPKTKGDAWTYKILYSFQGSRDGYFPWGDLVFDSAGNLYGATQFGGGYGSCDSPFYRYCGTVFEVRPAEDQGR